MLNASLKNNDFICLVLQSTNIIYSKVNNKIFVQPYRFLLYTLEMPVTESPTAVAVQHYTQLDDPEFNFYFHHNKC